MALTLPDSTLDSYYQNLVANYKPQEISYQDITTEQKTESNLASAIAAYLEPYKKKSVSSIESSLRSQRASADADAASRGMGTSTYLSDLKSRMSRQAQSDISNIESDFVSSIGQRTAEAYQNQLNRVLNVNQVNAANRLSKEQWNAQEKNRAEAEAWNRAFILAQYAPASSGGSGGSGSGGSSYYVPSPEDDGIREVASNAWASYEPPRTGSALFRTGNAPKDTKKNTKPALR